MSSRAMATADKIALKLKTRSRGGAHRSMSLNVAVQMDPIERINIRGDSTFALLLEAQARAHRLAYYTPDRLALRDGKVSATVQALEVRDVAGGHFTLG